MGLVVRLRSQLVRVLDKQLFPSKRRVVEGQEHRVLVKPARGQRPASCAVGGRDDRVAQWGFAAGPEAQLDTCHGSAAPVERAAFEPQRLGGVHHEFSLEVLGVVQEERVHYAGVPGLCRRVAEEQPWCLGAEEPLDRRVALVVGRSAEQVMVGIGRDVAELVRDRSHRRNEARNVGEGGHLDAFQGLSVSVDDLRQHLAFGAQLDGGEQPCVTRGIGDVDPTDLCAGADHQERRSVVPEKRRGDREVAVFFGRGHGDHGGRRKDDLWVGAEGEDLGGLARSTAASADNRAAERAACGCCRRGSFRRCTWGTASDGHGRWRRACGQVALLGLRKNGHI